MKLEHGQAGNKSDGKRLDFLFSYRIFGTVALGAVASTFYLGLVSGFGQQVGLADAAIPLTGALLLGQTNQEGSLLYHRICILHCSCCLNRYRNCSVHSIGSSKRCEDQLEHLNDRGPQNTKYLIINEEYASLYR